MRAPARALRVLQVLLRKEFLQIRRDPVILRMLIVVPMIQLVVLANAATFEVKTAALWVVDQDRSSRADALLDHFTASGRFRIVGRSAIAAPADRALLDGRADAVLVLPRDFERELVRERHGVVQLVLNAENGPQAGVLQSYASTIVMRFSRELANGRSGGDFGGTEPPPRPGRAVMDVSTRSYYNMSLDYRHFMVPGILVQLVTLVGTLMTALNIVREKEAGTLDQLNVTPIRPSVFIAAKLIPMWVIGVLEFTLGLCIAVFVFGVPVEGNLVTLYVGVMTFLVAALGIGLLISTVSETQQQALFVTFSFMMIYILMSGLFTPVRAMPRPVQIAAQVNPMLHFIALVRAVLLKGASFADVWRQIGALVVIGVTILSIAVSRYRKRAA